MTENESCLKAGRSSGAHCGIYFKQSICFKCQRRNPEQDVHLCLGRSCLLVALLLLHPLVLDTGVVDDVVRQVWKVRPRNGVVGSVRV